MLINYNTNLIRRVFVLLFILPFTTYHLFSCSSHHRSTRVQFFYNIVFSPNSSIGVNSVHCARVEFIPIHLCARTAHVCYIFYIFFSPLLPTSIPLHFGSTSHISELNTNFKAPSIHSCIIMRTPHTHFPTTQTESDHCNVTSHL